MTVGDTKYGKAGSQFQRRGHVPAPVGLKEKLSDRSRGQEGKAKNSTDSPQQAVESTGFATHWTRCKENALFPLHRHVILMNSESPYSHLKNEDNSIYLLEFQELNWITHENKPSGVLGTE